MSQDTRPLNLFYALINQFFLLQACEKLTNASLVSVAKYGKSLRHLDMRRCDRLAVCKDVLMDHIPSLLLPPAAVDPNEDLSPPPPVPPMPKKK